MILSKYVKKYFDKYFDHVILKLFVTVNCVYTMAACVQLLCTISVYTGHDVSSSSSSMHAGSCMPVHACRFIQYACTAAACMHACRLIHAGPCMPVHSCQLLLMRACARRAYCKKCRVDLGSKRSGWSNIPDLI